MGISSQFLPNTCSVDRQVTITPDNSGAPTSQGGWTVGIIIGVSCGIQPISAAARVYFAQRQMEVTHEVYFGQRIAIKRGDRLTFDDGTQMIVAGFWDEAHQGEVFVVVGYEML